MGNLFVAVVVGLQTALTIFVILASFNPANSNKTLLYRAGSSNLTPISNIVGIIRICQNRE